MNPMMDTFHVQRREWLQTIERDLEVITQTIPLSDLTMVTGNPSAELQAKALRHYKMVMPSVSGEGLPTTLEEKWLLHKTGLPQD